MKREGKGVEGEGDAWRKQDPRTSHESLRGLMHQLQHDAKSTTANLAHVRVVLGFASATEGPNMDEGEE